MCYYLFKKYGGNFVIILDDNGNIGLYMLCHEFNLHLKNIHARLMWHLLRNLNYPLTKIIQIGKAKSMQKSEVMLNYEASDFSLHIAIVHEGLK